MPIIDIFIIMYVVMMFIHMHNTTYFVSEIDSYGLVIPPSGLFRMDILMNGH